MSTRRSRGSWAHTPPSSSWLITPLLVLSLCRGTHQIAKNFVNSSTPDLRPTFVVNFDTSTVICQHSADPTDLHLHNMSSLCDGKQDCFVNPAMHDEVFPYCEHKCESTCSGKGACLYDGSKPQCYCDSGFSGSACELQDKNECLEHPCHMMAQCQNTLGSYECRCLPGYEGNGHEFDSILIALTILFSPKILIISYCIISIVLDLYFKYSPDLPWCHLFTGTSPSIELIVIGAVWMNSPKGNLIAYWFCTLDVILGFICLLTLPVISVAENATGHHLHLPFVSTFHSNFQFQVTSTGELFYVCIFLGMVSTLLILLFLALDLLKFSILRRLCHADREFAEKLRQAEQRV
uniref:EGF-like domain-containing protein n=1 Tax=Caenorhabditis tropicalis TaxID=1561998 RepID=A0A1I7TWX9_9PELO